MCCVDVCRQVCIQQSWTFIESRTYRSKLRFIQYSVMILVLFFNGCSAQYILTGDYDYGAFEDEIDIEVQCGDPPQIDNGETVVWGDGLLLEYRCKPGYFPVGITHGACDLFDGTWTIDPPICADKGCPTVTAPENGVVNIDDTGALATLACRPGYFLLGDNTLVCEDGRWTGVFPICAVTAVPDELSKSRLKPKLSRVPTSTLTLEESDETCFYNQVVPPEIDNAVFYTRYEMNELRQRYVMVATYTCMGGYRLRNPEANTLFCQNLIWSAPELPDCINENDPCEINNGGCSHYCVVTGKKKHACSCWDGYSLAADARNCVDTDECAIENGGCEQECFNNEGSYFCSCTPGFVPDGRNCTDIDECLKETLCPGPCVNIPGGYRCDCNTPGYTESDSPEHCNDIDECLEDNGGCDDRCINKLGTFECRCEQKGWRLGHNNRSCVDVDECSRYKNKICQHGWCTNTEGSFVCTCGQGFVQSVDNNMCTDKDECTDNNGGCAQTCENAVGSFMCACFEGYVIDDDGISCNDVNECRMKNGGCEDKCTNVVGSFTCSCTHVGFILAENGYSCDICNVTQFFDRETTSCRDCPPNAHARDGLALSVDDCLCDDGFHGVPEKDVSCQDTNECETGNLNCSFECVNTIGSAHCACPMGYQVMLDGSSCEDEDECAAENHHCSQLCTNTDGYYTCSCEPGYRLINRTVCEDIDECDIGTARCSQLCINTPGSYKCDCKKGFFMADDGYRCLDNDECAQDTYPCDQICSNTIGSYECQCESIGYQLSKDRRTCLDINECMEGDNPCPDVCVNTVGSYICDCDRPGFLLSGNGTWCVDINECEADPPPCDNLCVNTPGSFWCTCPPGYTLPGKGNKTVCKECDIGTYRGATDKFCQKCPPHSQTEYPASTTIADCLCQAGFKKTDDSFHLCVDIDECADFTFECEQGCVNTEGSAHCVCKPGYILHEDGRTCDDLDECLNQNGGCEQECVNSPGSYHCDCRKDKNRTFKLSENGRTCEEIDECELPNHGCEYRCVNTKTGTKCTCPAGHELASDQKKCQEIDECKRSNGGCTDKCHNTIGSFYCSCDITGFKLYRDGKQCTDMDECNQDVSPCEDVCVNTQGSYKCHCRQPGYHVASDGKSCEDVDECARSGRLCEQLCINLPGSFRCDCQPGYAKSGKYCDPCSKGKYRGKQDSVIACQSCPPGMTTDGEATTSLSDCFCDPGYQGNPETKDLCRDVNECSRNNGGCEQLCVNTLGSHICECRTGFELHTDNRTCVQTHCPVLSLPRYAKYKTKDCNAMKNRGLPLEVGTNCTYECRGKLILTGSETRTCLEDFTWSGEEPKCIAMPCARLPVPDNGYLHPPHCMLPRVPFRSRCSFRCKKGYKRKGRGATKCLANTKWSGKILKKLPTCEKKRPK